MRSLQLLGVAAEAETLRLRRSAAGAAKRAGWIAGAALFGAAAVASAHVAFVAALEPRLGLAGAAGAVTVLDLVIVGVALLVARSKQRDPVAEEALALRRDALAAASRSPVQDVVGALAGNGAGPIIGAALGQALSIWLRRR